jgi:hypothetical protein
MREGPAEQGLLSIWPEQDRGAPDAFGGLLDFRRTARPDLQTEEATPLASPWLCSSHCHGAVLIDFNHVPSEVAAAMEPPPEALAGLGDDRVGVGTSLNRETLRDLRLQEGVERVLACPERIDFSVHRHT